MSPVQAIGDPEDDKIFPRVCVVMVIRDEAIFYVFPAEREPGSAVDVKSPPLHPPGQDEANLAIDIS